MPKNDRTQRLTDSIAYLHEISMELATEVTQLLETAGQVIKEQVGDAISLSGKTSLIGNFRTNNTDTQRDALRALLLCQRVYLTSVWSNSLGATPFPPQGTTWPDVTLNHFRYKPEVEIREAIRMYVPLDLATKSTLADAAGRRSLNPDNYYTTRRGSAHPPVGNSCFDQVSHWLLNSGYVSLRWMARYKPTGFNYSSFGAGNLWIASTAAIPAMPFQIQRGMIVRMFTDRRPGGHFMVSDGGGWGWGYNNSAMEAGGGEGAVPNGHARCLIHRQFGEYREETDRVSPTDFGGKLVLLDPDAVANRC